MRANTARVTLQLPTTSAGANLPPRQRMHDPILILVVQIGLILGLSRVMGFLFARIRQPQVIGEIQTHRQYDVKKVSVDGNPIAEQQIVECYGDRRKSREKPR